jgi:murein DD-endopeptidase MepM/ murein hydrolase activator NlpD
VTFALATLALVALMSGPASLGPVWDSPVPGKLSVTSSYGWRHGQRHQGLDIEASRGTLVSAVADGTVIQKGWNRMAGNYITVEHPDGVQSIYCHLSKFFVVVGMYVGRGWPIGKSGNTGFSTGPHLHLGALKNGKYMDPMKLLRAL